MNWANALICAALLAAPTANAAAIPDAEAQRILFDLKSGQSALVSQGFERIEQSNDRRFVAPLIELLRARQLPIVRGIAKRPLVSLLEALSGEAHGDDWGEWVRWYAGSDLTPPPGFSGWKGSLYSRIDPNFGSLLPLGAPTKIRIEEIVWGGVPFEGIPALDDPAVISAAQADYLEPSEPVFGIVIGGEARAYPLRILDWHEMSNDTLGGVPFALAYCTLCGSGIAYDRRAPDGSVYDFGSSGFLMRSNKLMVDRQTRSLWNHLTGEPVVGPLVDGPAFALRVLPSVVTSWGDWKARHPKTTILSPETGYERSYEPGAAYADYFASDELMFPVRLRRSALAPKARVFGLRSAKGAKAWPIDEIAGQRVLNDRIGTTQVVLIAEDDAVEAAGASVRRGIPKRWSSGVEVRAYARGDHHFAAPTASDDTQHRATKMRDERGTLWRIEEDALVGADGARLERIPGIMAYWFGWASFHPHSELYRSETKAAQGSK